MIMNDDAFARLVAEDVKNHTDATQKAYLRADDVVDRWREALYALLDNLDDQLDGIDEEEQRSIKSYKALPNAERMIFETKESYGHRRTKIKRFRFHVEQRLAEADRLILLADNGGAISIESFLRKAIEMHRQMMQENDLEPNAIDEALWYAVKGQWRFGDVDVTEFE